jgi:hypothetical protein
MKLVSGKVTFVHRRLWPAVIAIGRASEPWQTVGLTRAAKTLLERVEKLGELAASGDDAKELATRLLAHGTQRHTAAGHHANMLQSWTHFMQAHDVTDELPAPADARRLLERTVAGWALDEAKRAKLPWQSKR